MKLASEGSIIDTLKIKKITEESLKDHMASLGCVEHNRWSAEKLVADFAFGSLPKNDAVLKKIIRRTLKVDNQLKRYDQLDNLNKEKDIDKFLLISLLKKIKENNKTH